MCCKLDKDDETELKVFRAKSIKVLSKIVFAVDLCPFLLENALEGKDRQSLVFVDEPDGLRLM